MSTLAGEIGVVAAENVEDIFESTAGASVGLDRDVWTVLTSGGWNAISSDPENGMELRDILEVARVTGRYTRSTPLVPTLLAGRWFDVGEDVLEAGATLAFRRGAETVVPYWSTDSAVLDGEGAQVAGEPVGVDDYALVAPTALLAGDVTPVGGERLAEARAAFLAVAVGCVDAVMDRTVDWVQTRQQFGQPLKNFQALRHQLADAHIAREHAWTAATAATQDPEHSARWAAMGFARARRAIEIGIQLHGGMGFTWEVGLHHHLNQIVQFDSFLGGLRPSAGRWGDDHD
jgi:hypothetical protein